MFVRILFILGGMEIDIKQVFLSQNDKYCLIVPINKEHDTNYLSDFFVCTKILQSCEPMTEFIWSDINKHFPIGDDGAECVSNLIRELLCQVENSTEVAENHIVEFHSAYGKRAVEVNKEQYVKAVLSFIRLDGVVKVRFRSNKYRSFRIGHFYESDIIYDTGYVHAQSLATIKRYFMKYKKLFNTLYYNFSTICYIERK